eukprot:1097902-Pleurochrysis_carterae.AAC.2
MRCNGAGAALGVVLCPRAQQRCSAAPTFPPPRVCSRDRAPSRRGVASCVADETQPELRQ